MEEMTESAEIKPEDEEKQEMKFDEKSFRLKIEKEIKEKLKKEATLSAEQKLNERIKKLETEKKSVVISKNKVSAERKFSQGGFSENDYKDFLDFIVNEDEEITLKRTKSIIQAIENAADRKIKDTMKNVKIPENSETKSIDNKDEILAKSLGKTRSESNKSAADTIQKYLGAT